MRSIICWPRICSTFAHLLNLRSYTDFELFHVSPIIKHPESNVIGATPGDRFSYIPFITHVHELGLLTDLDVAAFASYCQTYARWREAEEFISQHGAIVKTKSGYWQQVPQVSIAHQNKSKHRLRRSGAPSFIPLPGLSQQIATSP